MPPVAPQPVQITCPACGTSFRTGIYTLVDVTVQPELKPALLGGQLNVAVCPKCRTPSMIGAPLVYHDAAKQLCLVHVPAELNSSPQEQEQFVGEATSFLLRELPKDVSRAYLLAPRRFLSMQSLVEAIFEADGVSREALDRQRAHIELISELASVVGDEDQFASMVTQRRTDLTPEFFATLSAFVQATPPDQAETRQLLMAIQNQLLDTYDEEPPDEEEMQEALERLVAVADEELDLAVAELRPVLDYGFFELLTGRIEAAEQAGEQATAAALTDRRARILAAVEQLDREAEAMFEAGSALLQEVMQAPDPEAALRERGEAIDEAFMMVLSANVGAAQRAGRDDIETMLTRLADVAIDVIQARLSPEERFINELLMAETPQTATRLLRTNVARITPELIKQLNELADQEERRANKPIAERLRQLARECGAMLF
ncbi:CpXC domain-containing protein [Candidatus Chloroploca sp. Khr17]|uniref:CpXC domain-containing protein n=1 Tax=Candidatus Chloroploca sp. Khr17 TaxID=2496869 RepID=UPI00101BB8E2|nr:CpXC domain-containing protein [Candidatus Chloroploca sp. Khr17]